MQAEWMTYASLALGLASALVAGVFLSFSDFVMRSLAAARPESGLEAMRMINREVYRSAFLAMLLGLVPASIVLAAAAVATVGGSAALWIAAGAAVYALAVFLVTIFGNVPMNQRLDAMTSTSVDGVAYWRVYAVRWTRLNHVRTIGSIVAACCFLAGALALA